MVEFDKKKKYKMGIGRLSRFIEKNLYDTDWFLIATCCGVTEFLNERITRAQTFGDPDYPTAISRFLIDVFENDENTGLFLINETISQKTFKEPETTELNDILKFFSDGNVSISNCVQPLQFFESEKFISLPNYPENFYKKLIEEINFQYKTNHSMSLSILLRKLFENLIIDILRKKYGTQDLSMYYDTSKRRFHDFSVLLKNMESNLNDFHYISPNLNQKFISELNKYREFGNSGAHSIDVNITIEEFTTNKENINYKIDLLIHVLSRI
jgi:hypothetical protein